jgi:hypothetical protein
VELSRQHASAVESSRVRAAIAWESSTCGSFDYMRLLRPTEGRLAAMALMLPGIGLFGAITATTTSYLMSRDGQHGAEPTLADELERLAALHSAGAFTDDGFTVARRRPGVGAGVGLARWLESS